MGKIKLAVTVILCFALLGFFVARVSAEKISLPITGGVYQMITSPILPADPDPQVSLEVYLGPYDKTQWRFFRYDPAQTQYIELKTPDWSQEQDFDFGRGYWIISRNPAEIDIEGDPVDAVRLNQIVLKVGWNQIGNIYLQDFTIGMFPDCNLWVQPVNPGPLESSYQLNDLDNPYTHWTLKEYVEGLPYADIGLGLGEKLEKGKGYWLKNTYGRDVILSFDPAGLTAVSTSANFPGPEFFARVAQQEDPPDPPPGITSSFSSGSSGGSVGCFIATAVYRDYDHPNVRRLRRFRDRYLLANSFGRMFVDLYYSYSPTLAKFVANRDSVKTLVRFTLMPIVGLSSLCIKMNAYGFPIFLAFPIVMGFVFLIESGGGRGEMQSKIFTQIGRGKKKKVSSFTALSFLLLSGLISFSLTGCGGGGGGSSSVSGGPINPALFSGWEMTNGPFSGIVFSLAVDPNNSQGIYAAVQSGGLFTSGNGGQSWKHVEGGLENSFVLAAAVAVDTQTIYVGTKGDGIYKTVNGGVSWSQVSNGIPIDPQAQNQYLMVERLIIDPTDPGNNIVYAILDGGYYLYKTTNGGNIWEKIGGGLPLDRIRSFAIHPVDTQIVYAGMYQNGIFKSEDGGLTWTPINGNFPAYIVHFSCIGIDPGNPIDPDDDIIYAGTHDYGLYKTEDQGNTWQFIPIGDLTVSDNWSVYAMAMDPANKSTIYAYVKIVQLDPPRSADDGLFRTSDSGFTWEKVSFYENYVVRDVIMAPSDGNVVYVTTQGDGLFMTNDVMSVDDILDWEPIDKGLVDTPVYTMILNPGDNEVVYAGTDEGFFKTTNGGLTWERKGLEGKSVFALVSDPNDANIMYAATDSGVYKTTDGGESWLVISTGYQLNCLAIGKDPLPPNNNIIYGGNSFGMGIYRAEDDGSISWEEKNGGLTEDEKYVQCLAIDPFDPSILYAGTGYRRMPGPETAGKVIKTSDGGDTWGREVDGLPPDEPINSLSIDPQNPQTLYAGTYVGLYASYDGGDHWQSKSVDLGISSLAIDPADPKIICAGTYEDGAFASGDGGQNWAQIEQGLTDDLNKQIISLAMDLGANNPVMYAGTGCGVFKAYK